MTRLRVGFIGAVREWGTGRSFTDYREMLVDAELDAVEVLPPHRFHAEMG